MFPAVYFDEFVLHGLYAVKNTVKIMNYAFEIILLIPVVVHLILLSETAQQILGHTTDLGGGTIEITASTNRVNHPIHKRRSLLILQSTQPKTKSNLLMNPIF